MMINVIQVFLFEKQHKYSFVEAERLPLRRRGATIQP